ncbi:MAG: hypothetical protein ACI81R_002333 [Bradymonadia bacterium]|jgi:hypothetical protein
MGRFTIMSALAASAFALGRASKRCPSGDARPATQNMARALLQANEALDRLEPALIPIAEGRGIQPLLLVRALSSL